MVCLFFFSLVSLVKKDCKINFSGQIFSVENRYWLIKYLHCRVSNLAQMIVPLVANNLKKIMTLSNISGFILAKNLSIVLIVIMQQIIKEIWKNILPKFILKILNLYKFNKFWSILKYLFCSITNLAQNLLLVLLVTNNLNSKLMLPGISEYIQAKNHFHVATVLIQQLKKDLWNNILPKFTIKLPYLYKLNKFWWIINFDQF